MRADITDKTKPKQPAQQDRNCEIARQTDTHTHSTTTFFLECYN